MSLGPVMMDLEGTEISQTEEELLQNPLVGGVILFTRNFASIEQISALVAEIHAVRTPHLLVAIDPGDSPIVADRQAGCSRPNFGRSASISVLRRCWILLMVSVV